MKRDRDEIRACWFDDLRTGRVTLEQLRWCLALAKRTPRDNRAFIAALEQLEQLDYTSSAPP